MKFDLEGTNREHERTYISDHFGISVKLQQCPQLETLPEDRFCLAGTDLIPQGYNILAPGLKNKWFLLRGNDPFEGNLEGYWNTHGVYTADIMTSDDNEINTPLDSKPNDITRFVPQIDHIQNLWLRAGGYRTNNAKYRDTVSAVFENSILHDKAVFFPH